MFPFNMQKAIQATARLLSRYEIEKLDEVCRKHRDDDEFDLVQITHDYEEWKKNDPGDSSKPIPFRDILEAVGREKDYADIASEAQAAQFIRSALEIS